MSARRPPDTGAGRNGVTPAQRRLSPSPAITRRSFVAGAASVAAAAGSGGILALPAQATTPGEVYPVGDQFPLGWLGIGSGSAMADEAAYGWNLCHRYSPGGVPPDYPDLAAAAGMDMIFKIPGEDDPPASYEPDETEVSAYISSNSSHSHLAWWYLPEELRYWRAGEMAILTSYTDWTREYDPDERPNCMYEPNHRQRAGLAHTIPYLDVVMVGCYVSIGDGKPDSWVRWRIEELIHGISDAGATVGNDYLTGEKTPVATLEMYWDGSGPSPTPESVYHNFWQALVSGARGIVVYSYGRRVDVPSYPDVLDSYNQAASELTSPEGVDQAVLFGSELSGLSVNITDGPATAPPVTPTHWTGDPFVYPSVDVLAKEWNGSTYIIAVNSSESNVTATVSGIPQPSDGLAHLPFEGSSVPVAAGEVDVSFAPLGVRVMRVDATSSS